MMICPEMQSTMESHLVQSLVKYLTDIGTSSNTLLVSGLRVNSHETAKVY